MGLAIAQLLASRGAKLSLADINDGSLRAAVASLPHADMHMHRVVDVRDRQSVDGWIEATKAKYGRLDGAVNMAGVIKPATPVKDLEDAAWDNVFSINTRGVFVCMRAQLRAMEKGGSIVCTLFPTLDQVLTVPRYLLLVYSVRSELQATLHIVPAKQP